MDRYASEQPLMLMKIALNLTDSSLASRSDTHHYQGISPIQSLWLLYWRLGLSRAEGGPAHSRHLRKPLLRTSELLVWFLATRDAIKLLAAHVRAGGREGLPETEKKSASPIQQHSTGVMGVDFGFGAQIYHFHY